MTMKTITLFIIAISVACQSFSQDHYRTKRVNGIQFTLPPHSRLNSEGWFCNKDNYTFKTGSKYRYQYMAIKGLKTPNYYTASAAVEAADYFHARGKQTALLQKKYCAIAAPSISTADGSAALYISTDGSCAVIEIDMDVMFSGDIRTNYFKMTISLLEMLQGKEKDPNITWTRGISQKIIADLYQLIPYPEESSLLRFVADGNTTRSFVLLNPSIHLKVDAVERINVSGTVKWGYRLLGTNLITFTRSNDGKLVQSPFRHFQEALANVPDNVLTGKNILQASTADIQFSSALSELPYIFLQQEGFKKNNNDGSSDGPCTFTEETLTDKCNSVLYHFDDLSSFYDGNTLDITHAKNLSSFGTRNLITPVIPVIINGRRELVPLNTSLLQLQASYNIANSMEFTRLRMGTYMKVDVKKNDDVLLIPGDTINY